MVDIRPVLEQLGVTPRQIRAAPSPSEAENANWHVWQASGERCVLRRYNVYATWEELEYEHTVLRYLGGQGWSVAEPLSSLLEYKGRWFCLTRFVPGTGRGDETLVQRRRRGTDLARLDVALRPLTAQLGQRPGWRPLHTATTVHTAVDWNARLEALAIEHPRLADWASRAALSTAAELGAIGAGALFLTLIHSDFTSWNVHYKRGRLGGVIDFALAHVDSRPFELAIARTYRAPEVIQAYREELIRCSWPLTGLEEAAIEPVYRAFRVDMVAWALETGLRTGHFDVEMIERQLARTGAEWMPA